MASVRKFVNCGANLEGNLPLLQTWYYEKGRVHQLEPTISYESRLRPLIQNWSEEKAKKVDNIIHNNYLGVGEYVEDLMRPFIRAQDGMLAKPKTGTQDDMASPASRASTGFSREPINRPSPELHCVEVLKILS
ncbi:epstein-barr virus ebna-1-like protein [Hordeum vulgare]|nr:epstein-barr virus ebna-1-like protein [Hordeum vulgare]